MPKQKLLISPSQALFSNINYNICLLQSQEIIAIYLERVGAFLPLPYSLIADRNIQTGKLN
jgi:hypothetical protein